MYLDQPVALVTGSSRGIGRGIAKHLARDGYRVILHGRSAGPAIAEAQAEIEAEGGSCLVCTGSLEKRENLDGILAFIDQEVGRLDFFVSNAGIEPPGRSILDLDEAYLDEILAVNLKAPIYLGRMLAQRMIRWQKEGLVPRARMAFITSTQSYRVSGGSGYCIAKAGLHMAIQHFATALGPDEIPVLEVIPGVIPTDMSLEHKDNIDKMIAGGRWTVMPRWGTVDEMGQMLAAIGRGVFDYSTGVAIDVSGGMNIFRL